VRISVNYPDLHNPIFYHCSDDTTVHGANPRYGSSWVAFSRTCPVTHIPSYIRFHLHDGCCSPTMKVQKIPSFGARHSPVQTFGDSKSKSIGRLSLSSNLLRVTRILMWLSLCVTNSSNPLAKTSLQISFLDTAGGEVSANSHYEVQISQKAAA